MKNPTEMGSLGGMFCVGNLAQELELDLKVKVSQDKNTEGNEPKWLNLPFDLIEDTWIKYQADNGLKTPVIRRQVLAAVIDWFCKFKDGVCKAINTTLQLILEKVGFKISARQLSEDLNLIEKEGLIERKQIFTSNQHSYRLIYTKLQSKIGRSINKLIKDISLISKSAVRSIRKVGKPINVHEVVEFFISTLKKPATEARRFNHYYEKRSWILKGKPVVNWMKLAELWKDFKQS